MNAAAKLSTGPSRACTREAFYDPAIEDDADAATPYAPCLQRLANTVRSALKVPPVKKCSLFGPFQSPFAPFPISVRAGDRLGAVSAKTNVKGLVRQGTETGCLRPAFRYAVRPANIRVALDPLVVGCRVPTAEVQRPISIANHADLRLRLGAVALRPATESTHLDIWGMSGSQNYTAIVRIDHKPDHLPSR